jgi:8-oxo-dGTP pyrophosphatase MutT (NUDIX family)
MPVQDSFVERLRAALAARRPVRIERPEARGAAVAILVTAGADPAILFVERKVREGDPWSGQMALPGGFAAPADASLPATAERETAEETGVTVPGTGAFLGILDDVSPRTPYLPPLVVTPCLYVVPERLEATPGPEVESAVWLPVAQLYDPGSRKPYRLQFRGVNREFESIVIGRYTIWGLTERVLRQLGDLAGV